MRRTHGSLESGREVRCHAKSSGRHGRRDRGLVPPDGVGRMAPPRGGTARGPGQSLFTGTRCDGQGPARFRRPDRRPPADRQRRVPPQRPRPVAPYRYSWHSTEVWDGPARVQAVARDATGRVVAESAAVPFRVDNAGGRIRFASPDTARTLRGVVKWAVEVDRPQSEKEIKRNKAAGEPPDKKTEAIMFFVDGRLLHISFGTSHGSIELDTTELANGRHELFASAWAFAEGIPPFAMAQVPVTVDNGHAPRQLRPRWRELRLAPGQSADLAPRLTYTDGIGDVPARGARFSSANPAVATVDIEGRVRGIAPGVTTVAIEAGGRKAASSVIVDAQEGLAHFGRDGRILRRYDPKQSQFVRTMFGLGPDEIGRDPSLATQAHAAGINALETGFYNNPADGSHPPDLATWKRGWDPSWGRIERAAVE